MEARFFAVMAVASIVYMGIACAGSAVTPVKPTTDASQTAIEKACSNLAVLKCSEAGDTCTVVMTRAMTLTPIDVDCIINAKTQADVRKCPAIQCK